MYEYRQYGEGFETTHVWKDGSRCTANPFLLTGATGVILGDSFTEAFQVRDEAIAASVIERTARGHGVPLNVRQYGWSGVSVPVYVAIAPNILASLTPAWVTVVLNESDIGTNGLTDSRFWQAVLSPGGELVLKELPETSRLAHHSAAWRIMRGVMENSTLTYLTVKKVQQIVEASPIQESSASGPTHDAGAADESATFAEVRALKRAYERSKLLVVYVPHTPISGKERLEEQGLLRACAAEGVKCLSMRERMIQARDREHRMLSGFSNTEPGDGHLNADGHRALAELIWENVNELTDRR